MIGPYALAMPRMITEQIGTGFKGFGGTTTRAVVLQGQHHKQTRPQPDHHGQAAEVMLSMSPPRPRVDEKLPSSAPETSPRRRGSFVASWPIVAPARGSKNAAVAGGPHPIARTRRRGGGGAAACSSRTKGGAWPAASTTETAHPSPRRRARPQRLEYSTPQRDPCTPHRRPRPS